MGMDALTSAAFDSLTKEVLPKLVEQLQALAVLPPEQRVSESDLAALAAEVQALFGLMAPWFGIPAAAAPGSSDNIRGTSIGGTVIRSKTGADQTTTYETVTDETMSDDEARALLAAMDAPLEQAAPASAAPADQDMSDDEAKALLAQMDAPIAAASEDMSDDEARALLAEMDAPLSTTATPPPSPPNVTKPAIATAANLGKQAPTADDEAMMLLHAMGGHEGEEGEEEASKRHLSSPSPATASLLGAAAASPRGATVAADQGTPEGDDADGEELIEIDEFSKNDFASDPDMLNDFMSNSDELMQTLDGEILKLEQNPEDRETIESIFRAAHTLKGAAGMFGFKAIERVMHRMENLFELVRKGRLRPDANTIDVVFQGLDVLRILLEAVKTGKPSGTKTVPVVKALSLAAQGKYVKGSAKAATTAGPSTAQSLTEQPAPAEASSDEPANAGADTGAKGPKKKQDSQQNTIRVDLERLDHLVNLVGELVIDRTRFASIEEEIRTFNPQIKVAGHLSETVQLFGRHMSEVHEIIMKIRMVPIGNAFNKFTRIVRDLARQLGKEIELRIDGEETELDKTLVEQIGDPLIHLIRNSCDHGIEMPDVRRSQGKSPTGRVFLGAHQEGNHIIITIEDDGKGLDVERIRKKAIERGLIGEDTVMSKTEIFNLIFEAGFSTADKVTTVSGRGVGMDVVRKQISKLKGIIDLDSEPGRGTTTTIRLPLTLAIVQSLLVEVQQETFAIPLSTVVESVRIKPEEIQRVGDTEVIKRHDKVLPLMYLHDTLGLASKTEHSWYCGTGREEDAGQAQSAAQRLLRRKERLYVVIVGSGDRRFGIVVDQLLTQQEMVIKSMGPIMRRTPCVAGGAVLGNGEVVLVLDVQELEDHFRMKSRQLPAAA